jgi:hypothetical protein
MDDPVSSKSYESGVQMLQQAADKMDESLDDIYKYIFGHSMTQMTATAGIKKHSQTLYYRSSVSLTARTFLNNLTHLRSPPVRSEKPFALITLLKRSILAS